MGNYNLLVPAAIAYQYYEQLILGPALMIALAICIALVIRFPASRRWMGALLVLMGCVVVFTTLRLVFFWGMLIGLSTLIIGMVFVAKGTASRVETFLSTAKLIGALLLIGTVVILLAVPTTSFAVFIVGLFALIGGAALGAVYLSLRLKNPSLRIKIGGVLVAVGFAEIFALWSVMFVWNFIIGLTTLSVGIASCAAGLQPWVNKYLSQRKIHVLKHGIYVVLAAVIVASGLLISIRTTTNVIHEQWLENYYGSTAPNLTLRGTVTGIALNQEVNTGYSYHIFQAVITLNITEFVWAEDGWWGNQTSAAQYWQNYGSVAVFYEKTDVPELAVGQTVEMNGRLMMPLEDSLYSGKVVIPPGTNDCYIRPL